MAWETATRQQQVGTKRPAPSTPLDEAAHELQHTLITRLRVVTRVAALLRL